MIKTLDWQLAGDKLLSQDGRFVIHYLDQCKASRAYILNDCDTRQQVRGTLGECKQAAVDEINIELKERRQKHGVHIVYLGRQYTRWHKGATAHYVNDQLKTIATVVDLLGDDSGTLTCMDNGEEIKMGPEVTNMSIDEIDAYVLDRAVV